MSYVPNVGDVCLINNKKQVIIDIKIYEDFGSCCYDRSYKVHPLDKMLELSLVPLNDIGEWVHFKGVTRINVEKVEDVAPFEIHEVTYISIRQKTPKTITVYE